MKRFIYSGCSFTEWGFPTWADIIAYDKINRGEIDFAYNMALMGACNYYIMSSLLMAKLALNITSNDLIGIVWSSFWRHSLIDPIAHHWITKGGVYNHPVWDNFGLDHIDAVNNDIYLLQRSATAYNTVHELFDVDFELRLPLHCDTANVEDALNLLTSDYDYQDIGNPDYTLLSYIKSNINNFLKVPEIEYISDRGPAVWDWDGHPSLQEHVAIAQTQSDLLDSTVEVFCGAHNNMLEIIESCVLQNKNKNDIRESLINQKFIGDPRRSSNYGDPDVWSKIIYFGADRFEMSLFSDGA